MKTFAYFAFRRWARAVPLALVVPSTKQTAQRSALAMRPRSLIVMAVALAFMAHVSSAPAVAQARRVLIYGPSVWGAPSAEQRTAEALGFSVTVADAGTWSAMATADFAAYNAIVFGDQLCGIPPYWLAAAEANSATWSAAINGPVLVLGTDPVWHAGDLLIRNGIAFAAGGGGTGLYASLSCAYLYAAQGTKVPLLQNIGLFTVEACGGNGTILDSAHPVMAGLTDLDFSIWFKMSPHECFDSFPAEFEVLVQETSQGRPYIVARNGPPDRTPPEAVLKFDLPNQDVRVEGQDAESGIDTVLCFPGEPGVGCSVFSYERGCGIYDKAGNKTSVRLKVDKAGNELWGTVTLLQYCVPSSCGRPVTPPANQMRFSWSIEDGQLREFTQELHVDADPQQVAQAQFNAEKNITMIEMNGQKLVRPGLALLGLATDKGNLSVRIPK